MSLSLFIMLIFFSNLLYGIEPDKKKHLSVSIGISGVSQIFFKDTIKSFGICAVIGVGKEIYDHSQVQNKMDKQDLVFDAVGCLIGSVMMKGIQYFLSIK